tara:strand:- start:3501 stop:3869 length:369 start_codon:yes stop_codon:yes gene_type:complete
VQQLNQLPKQVMEEAKEPFEWYGLLWKPKFNKFGFPIAYYSELKNLNLSIRDYELTVTNSLQKFYMDNNFDTFTYTQVIDAFQKLNNCLPFNIYKAAVKKNSNRCCYSRRCKSNSKFLGEFF